MNHRRIAALLLIAVARTTTACTPPPSPVPAVRRTPPTVLLIPPLYAERTDDGTIVESEDPPVDICDPTDEQIQFVLASVAGSPLTEDDIRVLFDMLCEAPEDLFGGGL